MKKTLLIAAAALAAGIVSTQAAVYSQNIVGYANVATPVGSANYCISVPFAIGVSNGANEVFSTNLPNGSQILIYNQGTGDYDSYNVLHSSSTGWVDGNFTAINPPILPVGLGFFLVPGDDNVTNTFVGSVAINTGTTNTTTFPTGSANYLVGAVVPYAGYATNSSVNLNDLSNGSQVLIYNQGTGDYDSYNVLHSSSTGWVDSNFTPIAPPIITVGLGFFVVPGADNDIWKQSL